jgi:hypothetical protein
MLYYQLLMCLWPVSEMTDLVSGVSAPQCWDESSWVRGSELDRGSSDSCVGVDWWQMLSRATLSSIPFAVSSLLSPHSSRDTAAGTALRSSPFRGNILLSASCLFQLFVLFNPDDRGNMIHRNVGWFTSYTYLYSFLTRVLLLIVSPLHPSFTSSHAIALFPTVPHIRHLPKH